MSTDYVLIRTDGKYVARPGSEHSYTSRLEDAKLFPTRAAAEAERCVENERVARLDDVIVDTCIRSAK